MEGLTDAPMRQILTQLSPYDWCVSEFLRVTDHAYAPKVFRRHCPEMDQGWRTHRGTPVHLQLLGSDPAAMAANARVAASLGAPAIDLNFGCPARLVNRHGGGAALLADHQALYDIAVAVRDAVPVSIPVSAKMRLGVSDASGLLERVGVLVDAGISWLTVHARTRDQGYRPPVYWEDLQRVRSAFPALTLYANGDVVSVASASDCLATTGASGLMLGRGAVREPDLVQRIKHPETVPLCWPDLVAFQLAWLDLMPAHERAATDRYKQWLAMMTPVYPAAQSLFQVIKRERSLAALKDALAQSRFT